MSVIRECGSRCPTGLVGDYVCNRYEDHIGDHEAHYQEPSGRWVVLAHWSDAEAVPCVHRVMTDAGVVDVRKRG